MDETSGVGAGPEQRGEDHDPPSPIGPTGQIDGRRDEPVDDGHDEPVDDHPAGLLVEDPPDGNGDGDGSVSAGAAAPMVPIDDPEHPARDWQLWVSWAVVALCSAFVFFSLDAGLLLQDSTPTGGDMGAHVWGPAFLQENLLTDLRVTGWTQDWYAGFPAYVFYMVVPSLFIVWVAAGSSLWDGSATAIVIGLLLRVVALGALVVGLRAGLARLRDHWTRPLLWVGFVGLAVLAVPVPYNIAFKLVSVSGLVTLPIAVYVFARAARVAFPGPPILAIASLMFIYDRGFTIFGGNGASTMAGEFAFSISLTFCLLYLAVAIRGSRRGRDRALGAVLLALTILCHLIPAIFAGIATFVLMFVRRDDRTPWWDANRTGRVVAGVLVAYTLLVLVPADRVPVLGGLVEQIAPQWLFPALASVVALVLFTGAQPGVLELWRGPVGRRRALGAALAAAGALLVALAAGLVDSSPWLWVLIAIAVAVAAFAGWDTRLVRWLLPVAPAGIAATMFWSLPFLSNSTFMNDMGWERYTRYTEHLLADAMPDLSLAGMPYRNVVYALAGLGILLALLQRVRLGWFLALVVTALAWIFRYFPQYRLWNARLLPFLYLALYLLAGLAVALVIRAVVIGVGELRARRTESFTVGAAGLGVVTIVMAVVLLGAVRALPGGQVETDPVDPGRTFYSWGPFDLETTIVGDWARWNYSGVENKDAYPEFAGIVEMMDRVSDEHGCGRAMWEYESDLQRFGTPMALMMLPYYTDECVGSMEGLYFEASSTTPFHFLNQSELSTAPSRAQRDLPYSAFDIDRGIRHLQLMGVQYYMATTDEAIAAARSSSRLEEVATETFVYSGADGIPVENTWAVFLVDDVELVTPLANDPIVLSDADDHIDGWVYAAELPPNEADGTRAAKNPGPAVLWYNDPERWDTFLATSGPADWARAPSADLAPPGELAPPVQPNDEVVVSEVELTSDSIAFSVDQIGEPVLVKVSYFPNWTVDGGEGPYRVSPNFMAVVPTQERVTLSYGRSGTEWAGWALALAGTVGILALAAADHRRRRSDDADDADDPDGHDAAAPDAPEHDASSEVTDAAGSTGSS